MRSFTAFTNDNYFSHNLGRELPVNWICVTNEFYMPLLSAHLFNLQIKVLCRSVGAAVVSRLC